MAVRALICTWLVVALAAPACCCTADALAKVAKSATPHSCCGGAAESERAPTTPACDCGCSRDLLTPGTPATDVPSFSPHGTWMAQPVVATLPGAHRVADISHRGHDPPGLGPHRFLIFGNFRC